MWVNGQVGQRGMRDAQITPLGVAWTRPQKTESRAPIGGIVRSTGIEQTTTRREQKRQAADFLPAKHLRLT
jgi:hypothetical protein